jgi:hypothetical protein
VSLLLLEMDFYLWCEEIVEYYYICYDYFIGFPIKVLVDRAMCKKSILQIYCMEEKNEIHQNQ